MSVAPKRVRTIEELLLEEFTKTILRVSDLNKVLILTIKLIAGNIPKSYGDVCCSVPKCPDNKTGEKIP